MGLGNGSVALNLYSTIPPPSQPLFKGLGWGWGMDCWERSSQPLFHLPKNVLFPLKTLPDPFCCFFFRWCLCIHSFCFFLYSSAFWWSGRIPVTPFFFLRFSFSMLRSFLFSAGSSSCLLFVPWLSLYSVLHLWNVFFFNQCFFLLLKFFFFCFFCLFFFFFFLVVLFSVSFFLFFVFFLPKVRFPFNFFLFFNLFVENYLFLVLFQKTLSFYALFFSFLNLFLCVVLVVTPVISCLRFLCPLVIKALVAF